MHNFSANANWKFVKGFLELIFYVCIIQVTFRVESFTIS